MKRMDKLKARLMGGPEGAESGVSKWDLLFPSFELNDGPFELNSGGINQTVVVEVYQLGLPTSRSVFDKILPPLRFNKLFK